MARNPKNKIIEPPLIIRGRGFSEFITFAKDKKYKPLLNQLNDKKYPVSKTDASYRTINSWSDAGLLLESDDRENGWRKFSFLDLIWLEIIKELRAIGFGLEKISVLRDCLFNNEFTEKNGDTAFFAFYTSHSQVEDVRLIVLASGKGTLAFTQEYHSSSILGTIPTTHTVININNIFAKLTGNAKYASTKNPAVFLDDKELELISKIKHEEISEARVKVRDNKVVRISYETLISNPENTIEEIRKILKDSGHREITIYQEGKKGYQIKRVDKT